MQVMELKTFPTFKLFNAKLLRLTVFGLFGVLATTSHAFAGNADLTELATTVADNTNSIPDFIAYICYICGTAMAVWGLLDIKGHVEQPNQKALKIGLSKIFLCGLLFSLPFVAEDVLIDTIAGFFSGGTVRVQSFNQFASAQGKQGFWDLITQIQDSTQILPDFMVYIAYIMATALMVYGLFGLRRSVEDPGRNAYKGPIAQLVAAAFLFFVPYLARVVYYTMTFGNGSIGLKASSYRFTGSNSQGTVGSMIDNAYDNAAVLPNFAVYIAYLVGIYFCIRGVLMLKDHANDGGRTPVIEPIKRLAVAGLCFSIPMLAEVLVNSFALTDASVQTSTGWSVTQSSTGGLDGMFIALAQNTVNPLLLAIEGFCYIAGILIIVFGMQRLVQSSQQGAKGPLGFGTISMFIVAAALLAFPHMVGVLSNTLFGSTSSLTKIAFMSSGGNIDPELEKNALNVLSACVAFIGVIGYLSVVRGLFIFKAYADGNGQATLFSATTHLIAGIIAVNLGQFVNYMQNTLGLDGTLKALTFS